MSRKFRLPLKQCLFFCLILPNFIAMATVQAQTSKRPGPVNFYDFRQIFNSNLPASLQEHLDELIYFPNAEILAVPAAKTAQEYEEKSAKMFMPVHPEDLYLEGQKISHLSEEEQENHPMRNLSRTQKINQKSIDAVLRKNLLTIVIVPGIFGEFIDTYPYHNLFVADYMKKSPYHQRWVKGLKKLQAAGAVEKTMTMQKSLAHTKAKDTKVGTTMVPLQDIVKVSSLYDKDGELVQAILLTLPKLSLESIGDQYEMADIYIKRLQDVFNVLGGAPENIVFLGYSRGGPIVLDLTDKVQRTTLAWKKNIRASMTLGGVNYGTAIADSATCFTKGTPREVDSVNCRKLALLQDLANDLQFVDTDSSATSLFGPMLQMPIMLSNTLRWLQFFKEYAALDPNMRALGDISGGFDLSAIVKQIADMERYTPALTRLDPRLGANLALAIGLQSFNLANFYSDYDVNLRKFKVVVDEVITSVRQLTTQDRWNWWKNSHLPTKNVRYYSWTAVMPNPSSSELAARLAVNPYSYDPETVDYQFLRDSYDDLLKESGQELNDTQVVLYKTKLSAQWSALLNPYYKTHPLKISWPAIMGTHHWGFSFPVAGQTVDGLENPFPRIPFFKSMAATVAFDLENGNIL